MAAAPEERLRVKSGSRLLLPFVFRVVLGCSVDGRWQKSRRYLEEEGEIREIAWILESYRVL